MMPLNEQAYEHLRKLITNDLLDYQTIYSETKLAKEINISRTPFRDAIHRLVQEGYIDIIPSKGFRVHQLTKQDVIETFQVRSALEGFCTLDITKKSATAECQTLFAELDLCMDHMKQILETTQSIEEFSKYDFKFHILIIDFIKNEQFSALFAMFLYRMQRLAALSLSHEGRMQSTYQEHMDILTCMRNGDSAQIYHVTLKHMDTPKGINLEDLFE